SIESLVDMVAGEDRDLVRGWVERLVADLDEAFLLHSPRFETRRIEMQAEFLDSPLRPAAFAGLSYPQNPDELRKFLTEKLAQGEQRLPPRRYDAAKVRGIVTPHIDFHRGGHSEAASYAPLRENVRATGKAFDTLVVLGIAHEGVGYPFCATAKGFETPFGVMECDGDFVRDLETKIGPRLLEEQMTHKNEHSIEFSAVFAQMFPELKASKIVPILCGGFWESLQSGGAPESAEPEVGEFIAALRQITQKHERAGKKIGFIASVDGAHVGTQFGDDTPLTRARLAQIQGEDRKWCAAIEAGNKAALHAHFARDGNRFNVDAHPALYTLLAAFPDWRGQLLDYDQAWSAEANIVVSFASLALFES
ncbi:MAG: AmmeMemoRadiSam system protein B, partial [Armatimonadetes bacterium]|nr:AmmeMemoRadiSam system protein B [Armatimonadota bacterium]